MFSNVVYGRPSPIMSAYSEENRLDRIQMAWSIMTSFGICLGDIVSLHDYKGDLHVLWLNTTTPEKRLIVERAWEAVGESQDRVYHTLIGSL